MWLDGCRNNEWMGQEAGARGLFPLLVRTDHADYVRLMLSQWSMVWHRMRPEAR